MAAVASSRSSRPWRAVAGAWIVGLVGFAGGSRAGVVDCGVTIPPATSGLCNFTAGSNGALRYRGAIITPKKTYLGAQLVIAPDGTVDCVDCDCSASPFAAAAAKLDCAQGVATPGLVDALDLLDGSYVPPLADTGERYDHRHDWRTGARGHAALTLPAAASLDARRLAEARLLLSGVTSVVGGSSGVSGLVRNLDDPANSGLPGAAAVTFTSFPLADSAGAFPPPGTCGYPGFDGPTTGRPYWATVAEGTDAEARTELVCLSDVGGSIPGSHNVLPHPAGVTLVHALALNPPDVFELAGQTIPASVAWTPRSDLRLYGQTTPVTMLARFGLHVALDTGWSPTGSRDMLRELRCAADFNRDYLAGFFDPEALLTAATLDGAAAAGAAIAARLGELDRGLMADVVIWDGTGKQPFDAVLSAEPRDVVLVLRGGVPMTGDAALVTALGGDASVCDDLVVCGRAKRECARRDLGVSLTQLLGSASGYATTLVSCGVPAGEPTCRPSRGEPDGVQYSGERTVADWDGDGVANGDDLCPVVFDPPRPLNGNLQADFDGDGRGDACDPCPSAVDPAECGLTAGADLSVTLSGPGTAHPGDLVHLTSVLTAGGGGPTAEARLFVATPAALSGLTWSCSPLALCPAANGSGAVDLWVDLASGQSVTVQLDGALDPSLEGNLLVLAHAQVGELEWDPDPSDNAAALAIRVRFNAVFSGGFESGTLAGWSAAFP